MTQNGFRQVENSFRSFSVKNYMKEACLLLMWVCSWKRKNKEKLKNSQDTRWIQIDLLPDSQVVGFIKRDQMFLGSG